MHATLVIDMETIDDNRQPEWEHICDRLQGSACPKGESPQPRRMGCVPTYCRY